jgi:hypothetical protein
LIKYINYTINLESQFLLRTTKIKLTSQKGEGDRFEDGR